MQRWGEDGFTKQELRKALSTWRVVLERYHRFGFIAYPLMRNTDILSLVTHSRSKRLVSMLFARTRSWRRFLVFITWPGRACSVP